METNNKQQFKVKKVEMRNDGESIYVEFKKGNKNGWFIYGLFGSDYERGIIESHYDEEDDEDIYEDIHDWVDDHIKGYTKITYDDKELGK